MSGRIGIMATREELHREIDELTGSEVERAQIVVWPEDQEQSLSAVRDRLGLRPVDAKELDELWDDLQAQMLPADGEGQVVTWPRGRGSRSASIGRG